jgi:hypothetical protein
MSGVSNLAIDIRTNGFGIPLPRDFDFVSITLSP